MSFLNAIVQAIIQGITEFLPVSSSGHLTLFNHLTGRAGDDGTLFMVLLHLGTLISVCFVYYKVLWNLVREFFSCLKDIFTGKFSFKNMSSNRRLLVMLVLATAPLLFFAPFKDQMEAIVNNGSLIVLGVCFLYTAGILFLADYSMKRNKAAKEMKATDALIIGVFQGIAILPGISRSGSTISSALILGLSRQEAVNFSFLMSIPVIIAADIIKMKDAIAAPPPPADILPMLIGVIVAAVVGFFAIKMIIWLIKTEKFKYFAYYCLVLGVVVVGMGIYEWMSGYHLAF